MEDVYLHWQLNYYCVICVLVEAIELVSPKVYKLLTAAYRDQRLIRPSRSRAFRQYSYTSGDDTLGFTLLLTCDKATSESPRLPIPQPVITLQPPHSEELCAQNAASCSRTGVSVC